MGLLIVNLRCPLPSSQGALAGSSPAAGPLLSISSSDCRCHRLSLGSSTDSYSRQQSYLSLAQWLFTSLGTISRFTDTLSLASKTRPTASQRHLLPSSPRCSHSPSHHPGTPGRDLPAAGPAKGKPPCLPGSRCHGHCQRCPSGHIYKKTREGPRGVRTRPLR